MDKPYGIIVFGANGSGKTTLGRELALDFNYKHMDIEDYYFEKLDIPYTKARSRDNALVLCLRILRNMAYLSFPLLAVTSSKRFLLSRFCQTHHSGG